MTKVKVSSTKPQIRIFVLHISSNFIKPVTLNLAATKVPQHVLKEKQLRTNFWWLFHNFCLQLDKLIQNKNHTMIEWSSKIFGKDAQLWISVQKLNLIALHLVTVFIIHSQGCKICFLKSLNRSPVMDQYSDQRSACVSFSG